MPFYHRLGDLPRKRHIVFRDNGRLLTEAVMGLEGFTGNESILYHLQSPCRVKELGEFEPIDHEEWVPEAHAHRHLATYGVEASGDDYLVIGIECEFPIEGNAVGWAVEQDCFGSWRPPAC